MKDLVKASIAVVGQSCQEKVIKVLNLSLQLLSDTVQAQKVEQDPALSMALRYAILHHQVIPKLVQKSEESNTIVTKKIHESLLDLSYNPKMGSDLVAEVILKQIAQHYEHKVINPKGLMAQLALLFKFETSFGLHLGQQSSIPSNKGGTALTVDAVLNASVPAVALNNQDVKNAAIKIILDVQKLSGEVKESHLAALPEKTREMLMERLSQVECRADANNRRKQDPGMLMSQAQTSDVLRQMQEASKVDFSLTPDSRDEFTESSKHAKREAFIKNKAIIEAKKDSKEKEDREACLQALLECFENATELDIVTNEEFVTQCTILLRESLET